MKYLYKLVLFTSFFLYVYGYNVINITVTGIIYGYKIGVLIGIVMGINRGINRGISTHPPIASNIYP